MCFDRGVREFKPFLKGSPVVSYGKVLMIHLQER